MGRFGFEYGQAALAAWVYGAVGEGDRAFRVLEASLGARVMPGFLLLDPRYDPLRGDARFGEVVGRLGLGVVGELGRSVRLGDSTQVRRGLAHSNASIPIRGGSG
jgi:hypothetical protein